MASRNFHKNRTKERKARQRAERLAYAKQRNRRRRVGLDPMPTVMAGAAMSAGAVLAALMSTRDHSPKMFVRGGKRVPFEYL